MTPHCNRSAQKLERTLVFVGLWAGANLLGVFHISCDTNREVSECKGFT